MSSANNVHRLYDEIWARKLASSPKAPPPGTRVAVAVEIAGRYGGGVLLDVGCGDGTLLALAEGCFDVLYGVELSPDAARATARHGAVAVVADLDQGLLPYRDCSVDLVTCLDVIEHVFDPRHLLAEIARVLRIGGHCVLATPNIRYWRHMRRLLIDGRFPRTSGDAEGFDGGHLHYFTFGDIDTLLHEGGLTPVERFGTYGGRGRRLPEVVRRVPSLQELLATGLFVVAQRKAA
ncbi:MAG: hypothetical protein NVS4B8_09140 [Herpetosiphon sp.]